MGFDCAECGTRCRLSATEGLEELERGRLLFCWADKGLVFEEWLEGGRGAWYFSKWSSTPFPIFFFFVRSRNACCSIESVLPYRLLFLRFVPWQSTARGRVHSFCQCIGHTLDMRNGFPRLTHH